MYFRSVIRLLPSVKKDIPLIERWECRDFKIRKNLNNYIKNMYYKNVNNNIKIYSNKKIKYNEQYETRDF